MIYRVILVLTILLNTSGLMAQSGSSVGLASSYTALARGSEAILWNPANLGFRKEGLPATSISLYAMKFALGNNALTRNIYDDYFTDANKVLTEEDMNWLLSRIPDDGMQGEVSSDVSLLAVAYKNFGFSFSTSALSDFNLPKTMFEIPVQGLDQKSYYFQPEGSAEAVGKLNFAYGKVIARNRWLVVDIKEIAVGATLSYLFGLGTFQTTAANLTTDITDNGMTAVGSYVGKGTANEDLDITGQGIGLNLAVSAKTWDDYNISLVLKNVVHYVNWNKTTKEYKGTLDTGDPKFILGSGQFEDLEEDDVYHDEEKDIPGFSTTQPLDIRCGVGRKIDQFTYAAEIGRVNEKMLFGLGGGVKWSIFNLYAGYSYRANHNFNIGLGLGGKHFIFDVGIGSYGGISSGSHKGLVFANSMRFGF